MTFSIERPSASAQPDPAFDNIQLALAIAAPQTLRALLCDSSPALISPVQLGSVQIDIGIPLPGTAELLDGILRYEQVHCVLAEPELGQTDSGMAERQPSYPILTQFRSDLQTLLWGVRREVAIATLTQAGFCHEQITAILQLPNQAWHKSWWTQIDERGHTVQPFQRWMRSRCQVNGTFTVQYQDYFPQEPPPCFASQSRSAPVFIQPRFRPFHETLAAINRARSQLSCGPAILIASELSDAETEGFIRQGVSLYTVSSHLQTSPSRCHLCAQNGCPLNGRDNSPVRQCAQFRLRSA